MDGSVGDGFHLAVDVDYAQKCMHRQHRLLIKNHYQKCYPCPGTWSRLPTLTITHWMTNYKWATNHYITNLKLLVETPAKGAANLKDQDKSNHYASKGKWASVKACNLTSPVYAIGSTDHALTPSFNINSNKVELPERKKGIRLWNTKKRIFKR